MTTSEQHGAETSLPRIPGVLSVDFRPFITAMNKSMRSIVKALNNPDVQRVIRRQRDLDEIRAIGRTELRRARNDLDFHVEGIYTDLGLERTPR